MYVIIFTNSIRSLWIEYWSQLYDTTYFMEKKGKLRIAVYNLQCAACYCNDHIKTKLQFIVLSKEYRSINSFQSDWSIPKKIFSSETAWPNEPNLVGSIYGRLSIKIAHLVPIPQQTWPAQAILVADWLIPKKSSTLKPLGQMNRNVLGSIYGRPSIKIVHFGSVNKHGQHRQFVLLIGRFIKNLLL